MTYLRPKVTNISVTRDNNILHQKRIYLQKNESSIFRHTVKVLFYRYAYRSKKS